MVEDREAWHTVVQGVTKKQDLVTENNHSELDTHAAPEDLECYN